MAESLKRTFEKHRTTMIAVLGLIAMALLVVPGLFGRETQTEESGAAEENLADYIAVTEQRLEEALSHIQGVGKAEVVLTLERGSERVYATEQQTGRGNRTSLTGESGKSIENTTDSNESYILVRGQNGEEQPVLLKVLEPEVRGAVVLCEGGGDPAVREAVVAAVRAALALPANKISVHQLTNGGK